MTKKIMFSLFVIFLGTASYAAVKCIAMGPDSTCVNTYNDTTGNGYNAEPGQSDWGTSCNSIIVHGISLCGKQDGHSVGDTVDSVSVSGNVADNTACYCKMVQPVVSRWAFAENRSTAGDCAWWCQNVCAGKLNDTSTTDNKKFHDTVLGVLYE